MRGIDLQVPNKSLSFYFVDDYGLTEMASHEGRTAEKKTDAEAMKLTFSEYVYHFLGKQLKETGRIEQRKFKVSIADFDFVKILGRGGFSKV